MDPDQNSNNLPNASTELKDIPNLALGDNGSEDYKAINLITQSNRTCAFLENKQVKCWGQNAGIRTTTNTIDKPIKHIFDTNYWVIIFVYSLQTIALLVKM